MKKSLKTLLLVVLVGTILTATGCNKKDETTANFKNPKTIQYKTEKGTIKLTYDDGGNYEVIKNSPYVILKNSSNNFRIDTDFSKNTVKEQEKSKETFSKIKNYKILDNIKFGEYEGYIQIDNKFATAIVYLYLDKEKDVISYIKINPVNTNDAIKEIDSGKKAEDVLYKQEKVQQILKTIKYEK